MFDDKLSATTQLTNVDFSVEYFVQHFSQARKIVVANVANSALTANLSAWCSTKNIRFTQVHSEQQKNTLISAYQEPTTLGIDRWLALLAATRLYPQKSVLIIDAGTATTVDFVNCDGQHQGGWILAGIQALFNGILAHSTLVFAKTKEQPSLAFGRNTTDNVNNACWAATLGMIKQAISQARQLGKIDHIIYTGGNGQALADLLLAEKSEHSEILLNSKVIENLIFHGLQEYCE